MTEYDEDRDDLLDDPEAEEDEDPDFEDDPSLAGNSPDELDDRRGG